jgi:hypothetical protein
MERNFNPLPEIKTKSVLRVREGWGLRLVLMLISVPLIATSNSDYIDENGLGAAILFTGFGILVDVGCIITFFEKGNKKIDLKENIKTNKKNQKRIEDEYEELYSTWQLKLEEINKPIILKNEEIKKINNELSPPSLSVIK